MKNDEEEGWYIMGYMKDGLLLAAGGAVGLIAGVMLCDELQDKKSDAVVNLADGTLSVDKLTAIVDKVRDEAFDAMSRCETDEERSVVFADCQDAIQNMQTVLTERGESMLRQVKERAELSAEVTKEVSNARSNHIKATIEGLTEELDKVLESIDPKSEVCRMV